MSIAGLVLLANGSPAVAEESPLPLHARIDQLVEAAQLGQPASLANDSEFVRRIHLDLIGRIPDTDTVREFLADGSPDKRVAMIDQLLDSPEHVRHLANVFDVMLMERRRHKHVTQAEWEQYLLDSFAQRKPFLQLVAELLRSDGTDPELRGAARFVLEREVEPNLLTRDVSRIFLGRDIQCSQCHDHPLVDDYYQSEYYGLYAFVGRSTLFVDAKNENKALIGEKGEGDVSYKSVFTEIEGESRPQLLDRDPLDEPVFAEGDEYIAKPDKEVRPVPKYSRRARLAEELAQGDHPAFRRNIANRLWAWMMGRGLVEPVDLHHSGNPAEHAEVLQLLADALGEHEFDLRQMLRELAQTKVYQRSVEPEFDWMEQVRQGLAQREAIEANREAAVQELEDVVKAHDELLATVKELRGEIAPLHQAYEEARQQEAQAAFQLREATAKLTEAQQQLAAREKVLATVQAAAAAAQEAAASLPDEPEVAAATAAFVKKSESISSEVTSLNESLAEHQQSSQAAEAADATARKTLQEADQTYTAQATPLREQEAEVRQLAEQLERQKNRRQVIDRQLARLRTLESRQETLLERLEVEQQLAQLAAADSELQRQQEELETRLSELDEAIQVARQDLEDVWTRQLALAPLKSLSPEQLAWSVLEATGTLAAHRRAVEKELDEKAEESEPLEGAERAAAIERGIHEKLQPSVVQFVRLFGAGEGQPQYDFFATVDQALFLTNGGPIQSWLKPSGSNLTQRLIQLDSAEAIAEELYLTVLSRPPAESERQWVEEALVSEPEAKSDIIQELAWALLTSAEFRFCP